MECALNRTKVTTPIPDLVSVGDELIYGLIVARPTMRAHLLPLGQLGGGGEEVGTMLR